MEDCDETASDYVSLLQEEERDHWVRRQILFVETEADDTERAKYEECDGVG